MQVLYEDNHLLAVNKPAGLAVQGDSTGDEHLLDLAALWLKNKYDKPGLAFVGLIHRLDRPVSGVVLLAKTSKGLSRMNELFRSKNIRKIYHAISREQLAAEQGTLQHYLGKDAKTNRALTYLKPKEGAKPAVLHYRHLQARNNLHLYEIELETGRFHQIRAQMAKTGAPLLGDVKYGAGTPLPGREVALHALKLEFKHPVTGEEIKITAPYPKSEWWQSFKSKP
ncbi:MAG: RluA family pseudouridine synthase [Bacteroidetes bacterium]|nr:RluA family pseudouridine synthase [Bacteroidota bacterium]